MVNDMKIDYKDILKKINKKNFVLRNLMMLSGLFLLAISFNIILLENNFVIGGASGTGVILDYLFKINPSITILLFNIFTVTLGFIFLGADTTKKSIIGALVLPLFIEITSGFTAPLVKYFIFDSMLLITLVAGGLVGLSMGIIYKSGYSTGGSDIIILIANKYLKITMGKGGILINGTIVIIGGFVFGIEKLLYTLILLFISSTLVDRILIGISDSKMFFIYTKKEKEIEEFIINVMNTGVTMIKAEGGYSKNKKHMIMCVVSNRDYFLFKESILEIDPGAFFVINDCYEVSGGKKRDNLPFNYDEDSVIIKNDKVV